jgi:hypothetical protein
MAGAGLGGIVTLIPVRKDDSLRQALEPAVEALPVLAEQVGRELVDGDGDDQPGALRRRGRSRRGGQRKRQQSGKPGQFHPCSP